MYSPLSIYHALISRRNILSGSLISSLLLIGSLWSPLKADTAKAAERIVLQFGYLSRSIPVASLEAFAKDGTIDEYLGWYLSRVNPSIQDDLRIALTTSRKIEPGEFSQLLHTPMGEDMLSYTGQFIRTDAGENGAKGIRGALVVAATQPEGISLLSFLEAFPTPSLRVDLGLVRAQYRRTRRTIADIDSFLNLVKETSLANAAQSPLSFNSEFTPPFGEIGSYSVIMRPLVLQDPNRLRTFPVDLYQPQDLNVVQGELSVLVLSHGLGGSRELFSEFAEQLASYGFVVVAPQHIGSDKSQQMAVRRWLESELFKVTEFVDRPRDISFLLDELERINATEFAGRLNLTKVGVIGHSFGGYTALALAGATVDFARVNQLCRSDTDIDVGLALLLTCRIQELQDSPEFIRLLSEGDLQDQRISLAIAVNPVSNLFGESGMSRIRVPVLMMGGITDFAAPILREQAEPFTWLTTSDKYLVVAEKVSHNREVTTLINRAFYSVEQSEEDLEIARQELRSTVLSLFLALSQVYVAGKEEYRPFLSSRYIVESSPEEFPLHMIRSLSQDAIPKTLN